MHANMVTYLTVLAAIVLLFDVVTAARQCYYLPTDPEWPNDAHWKLLNKTVGGKLIRGVPLARPCFGPNINDTTCAEVTQNWLGQDIL